MATTFRDVASGKLVVSAASPHQPTEVSATDRVVRVKRPIALQTEENSFIEKTLHYISSIRGADANKLVLSTNTKYPTRYVVLIRGMPLMSLEDLQNIRDMNQRIRSITLNMSEETIQVDVWRTEHAPKAARKKRRRGKNVVSTSYDLTSVDTRDKKCLGMFLYRLNCLEDIECQFDVSIDTSSPELYTLDLGILDTLALAPLERIMHESRAFCVGFDFDFPRHVVRAKCLRLAAPLKRRVLRLKAR
jgi:hypothetical protein